MISWQDVLEIVIEYRFWFLAVIALGLAKVIWGKTPWGKFIFNVGNWLQAATLTLALYGGFMAYVQWQVQILGKDVVLGGPPPAIAQDDGTPTDSDVKAWQSLKLKEEKKKETARKNWTK